VYSVTVRKLIPISDLYLRFRLCVDVGGDIHSICPESQILAKKQFNFYYFFVTP